MSLVVQRATKASHLEILNRRAYRRAMQKARGLGPAIDRREFIARSAALAGAAFTFPAVAAPAPPSPDELAFASVQDLSHHMQRGVISAVELAQSCLARIERLDRRGPMLGAMIELNPDALAIAAERDAERKAGRVRGSLHGIPIVVKDNVDTGDKLLTSAGSMIFAGGPAPRDAFVIERLRAAGAVLLGKTNLSEWANFRSTRSSSGWSARGGLTKNPHVLDRNPSGSSSGTACAVAAGLAPLGIGTETDGSIISPASICGVVGIKPTLGLLSRSGIIPIAHSQDTAGPMARSVADAAALLGPLTGMDPRDPVTRSSLGKSERDYTRHLRPGALAKARIGVPRNLAGFHPAVDAALEHAIAAMKSAGAVIVDPLSLPSAGQYDDSELEVLLYEFKADLPLYLASRGPSSPARSLADIIQFNERQRAAELPWFGQELFERALAKGSLEDPAYRAARERCLRLARDEGLDPLFAKHALDALICPSNAPAWLTDLVSGDHWLGGNTSFAAVAGYPSLTVPMGHTHSLPLGLSFIGRPWSEGRLIELGYAFERLTSAWKPPGFLPTLIA
jgi:amidase